MRISKRLINIKLPPQDDKKQNTKSVLINKTNFDERYLAKTILNKRNRLVLSTKNIISANELVAGLAT